MLRRAVAVKSALAIMLTGCTAGHHSVAGPLSRCSGPLSAPLKVTVTSGTSPSVSWTPACAVNHLNVLEVLDARDANSTGTRDSGGWGISSPDGFFGPPVHFGELPRGAVIQGGPSPLQPGRVYTASAWVVAPDDSTVLVAGSAKFQP